jgi:hypothetical protein
MSLIMMAGDPKSLHTTGTWLVENNAVISKYSKNPPFLNGHWLKMKRGGDHIMQVSL